MITIKHTQLIIKLAHGGQRDKGGKPYWTHPKRVAERLKWFPTEFRIVALLHDTLEDTYIKPQWLLDYGYSEQVVEAVKILSNNYKPSPMTYRQWIQYILSTENDVAIAVKYADFLDNSSPARVEELPDCDKGMVKRYTDAIKLFDYVAKYKDKYGFLKQIIAGDL